jgi:hypothetical protein
MDSFGRYDLGYVHGVEQARPIVDLEHYVKKLEGKIRLLTWATGFAATISAVTVLFSIRNLFRKRNKKDSLEREEAKSGTVKLGEGKVAISTNGQGDHKARKARRHVRDFEIRAT